MVMHLTLRKTCFNKNFIQNIFYLGIKIEKRNFSKVIFVTYFDI